MKNLILLDHYYAPAELTERIREWVDYDNHQRYHEAIGNVTPAAKLSGRDRMLLERREEGRTRSTPCLPNTASRRCRTRPSGRSPRKARPR